MDVTFTGTRRGMSLGQRVALKQVLDLLDVNVKFHHGAAIGADSQATAIASQAGLTTVAHPAGADPLERNREMVRLADLVIAAPDADDEVLRSGTWMTIRFARKLAVPCLVLKR